VDNTLSNGAPPGPLLDEDRIRAEVSTLLEGLQIPRASYSDVQLQAVQSGILFREPPPPPLSPPPRTPKTKGSVPDLQEEMIEAKLQLAGLRALLNLQDQERKRERKRERESEKGSGRDEAYGAQVSVPATASAASLDEGEQGARTYAPACVQGNAGGSNKDLLSGINWVQGPTAGDPSEGR
jgi:hypothetical protein